MSERRIVAVSQINAYIKNTLDSDPILQNIWVQGEISNFKLHYSGHMYLSLKDGGGVLRAVMFKGAVASLRFMPENGMQVIARGRISAYPRDGAYQLYIDEMEKEGEGALFVAFEKLKAKLRDEGLFEASRKKSIPAYPKCVGVATSATGAAIQDICNILKRRWPMARIVLHPVQVQGTGAAEDVAAAIRQFNTEKEADVLIVGRGGGSQEDLWAFNEEVLARAVAASEIPVISAVGHETDFTICDFVADLRAPTPSAAAELAVPDIGEVRATLSAMEKRMTNTLALMVSRRRERLRAFTSRLLVEKRRMDELSIAVDTLTTRAEAAMAAGLEKAERRLLQSATALDALSPLRVMARGYTVTSRGGKVLKTAADLSENDEISVRFTDGAALCRVLNVERSEKYGI